MRGWHGSSRGGLGALEPVRGSLGGQALARVLRRFTCLYSGTGGNFVVIGVLGDGVGNGGRGGSDMGVQPCAVGGIDAAPIMPWKKEPRWDSNQDTAQTIDLATATQCIFHNTPSRPPLRPPPTAAVQLPGAYTA